MPKIYLSPSTQEYNKTISGSSEEYYMNLIADAMIPYLEASGIEYGRNTPDMTALESAQKANESDYDLYLAIHSNASPEPFEGRVSGAEIYYYPGSVAGRRAATVFANNYSQIYPQPDKIQIIPLETLIELNKTRMPSILFEVAYHDNVPDFDWMVSNIPEIGRNLALSAADYFNVQFREPIGYADGIVTVSQGSLNVRSEPSTNSEIVGTLENGDVVRITERENNWFKISNGDIDGYVNAQYIRGL